MEPLDKATELAARIADGETIDWASCDAGDDALTAELRAVALLAGLHRSGQGDDDAGGASWGPLRLARQIGAGRYGEVYRAWDPRLHRYVALKLLYAAIDDPGSPTRAIDEARLLARVRHPNVLTVYGAENIDGRIGIWTELIDGRTLEAELAERGRLPAAEVAAIGRDLSRALAAVHEAGALHRDVKPANVMRGADGRIVLMDFGTGLDLARESSTGAGLAGTPLYLAPEVLRGGEPTASSDVYALAVLLFRLVTGRYPIEGSTLDDVRSRLDQSGAPSVCAVCPQAPLWIARAIERGLDRDPAKRWPSGVDFERGLTTPRRTTTMQMVWAVTMLAVVSSAALVVWNYATLWNPDGSLPERLCTACSDNQAAISADGRWLIRPDWANNDLAIRDLSRPFETTLETTLGIRPPGAMPKGFADQPVFSRDARRVAFRWMTHVGVPPQLHVADLTARGSASARQLLTGQDFQAIAIHDWSADGGEILATLAPQKGGNARVLAWVRVADSRTRVIRSFDSTKEQIARRIRVSPDGMRLVFASWQSPSVPIPSGTNRQQSVRVCATDGRAEVAIVATASLNTHPIWAPDGERVFYLSNQSGRTNLWSIGVGPAAPVGAAERVLEDVEGPALGIAPNGDYYFTKEQGAIDEIFVAATIDGRAPVEAASDFKIVGNRPKWSPDGEWLAYLRPRKSSRDIELVLRDAKATEHIVKLGDSPLPFFWMSDSRHLLVQEKRTPGRPQLLKLDLSTMRTEPVGMPPPENLARTSAAALSPDGKVLYAGGGDVDIANDFTRIVAIDLDSGKPRTVWTFPEDYRNRPGGGGIGLALSPDGQFLAVAQWNPVMKTARLFVVGVDGTGFRVLVDQYRTERNHEKVIWTSTGDVLHAEATEVATGGVTSWRIMSIPADGVGSSRKLLEVRGSDSGVTFDLNRKSGALVFHPNPATSQPFSPTSGLRDELWRLNLAVAMRAR